MQTHTDAAGRNPVPTHSYRIGIDVGGTFTHAVALETRALDLVAQSRVPTTHRSKRGVGEGVVEALRALVNEARLAPEQVGFLAYSTTQVTNSLLEGDVAPVGIIAVGTGLEGRRAAKETAIGDIPLAPGRVLRTHHTYLDSTALDEAAIDGALATLTAAGAEAIVAAEAFSVDDPRKEQMILSRARQAGIAGTGTHEISGRYGLRIRTRTTAINASLLPRAVATADLTEQAAREIGIAAPLMVVRSDGGVMTAADMRRRPLLTLLSGPAAGVAAALMYTRVSDGIFMEVGGTSTDISALQHGRALLRTAEVGGHRLFLRTVDVRTVGIAGGSMARVRDGALHDVGPRSAHIAGLPYACFSAAEELERGGMPHVLLIAPVEGDSDDYAVLAPVSGPRAALTLTCAATAARQAGVDFASGDRGSARIAFEAMGRALHLSAEEAAARMLAVAAGGVEEVVRQLLTERNMDEGGSELIAGGGGAGVLAPAVGDRLHLPVRLSANAPVVSAIGTALALVRDVVERTVPEATEEDVLRIRKEAGEAVVRAGADPHGVTVDVEYDARTALLRAVASGQVELRERDLAKSEASDQERSLAAAKALGASASEVTVIADVGLLRAYRAEWQRKRFFGLARQRGHSVALVDQQGVSRLTVRGGVCRVFAGAHTRTALAELLDECTRYGDAGAELPQLFLGVRGKIISLSGLVSAEQVVSLAEAEAEGLAEDEQVLAVAAPRVG